MIKSFNRRSSIVSGLIFVTVMGIRALESLGYIDFRQANAKKMQALRKAEAGGQFGEKQGLAYLPGETVGQLQVGCSF